MRPIDADAIKPHKQLEPLGDGKYVCVHVAYMDDIDAMPTVDAVPVEWVRDEIDWLKGSDNVFAKLGAGQLEAMLKRWKDGDHHEG